MRQLKMAGVALALTVTITTAAFGQRTGEQRRQRPGADSLRDGRGQEMRGPLGGLLRGIELTANQKEQVQALVEENRPDRPDGVSAGRGNGPPMRGPGRGVDEATRAQIQAARERGDTAAIRRIMQAQRASMENERQELVQQVRSILTREQQVTFDANVLEQEKRIEAGGRGRGGRGGEPGQVPAKAKSTSRIGR